MGNEFHLNQKKKFFFFISPVLIWIWWSFTKIVIVNLCQRSISTFYILFLSKNERKLVKFCNFENVNLKKRIHLICWCHFNHKIKEFYTRFRLVIHLDKMMHLILHWCFEMVFFFSCRQNDDDWPWFVKNIFNQLFQW